MLANSHQPNLIGIDIKVRKLGGNNMVRWKLLLLVLAMLSVLVPVRGAFAADGDINVFEQLTGNYCLASGAVSLGTTQPNSFTVAVNGTVIRAYLYWSGRYPNVNNGDDQVQMQVNGGPQFTVTAAAAETAYAGYKIKNVPWYYYAYRSADLSPAGLNQMNATGNVTITATGLKNDQAHGVALMVVYESPTCTNSQLSLCPRHQRVQKVRPVRYRT